MPATLGKITFDGVAFDHEWKPAEASNVAVSTRPALDGTKHISFSPWYTGGAGSPIVASGLLNDDTWASLLTKHRAQTEGDLVTTYGTISAVLTKLTRTEVPGDPVGDGSKALYLVEAEFTPTEESWS